MSTCCDINIVYSSATAPVLSAHKITSQLLAKLIFFGLPSRKIGY